MYAASRRKQTPTVLRAFLSFSSRRCTSASTDILHSKTDPDVTSMKLSIPKPTSEMLPAIAPATTATRPSNAFHPIVKYSSLRPRWMTVVRSRTVLSLIPTLYNVEPRASAFAASLASCNECQRLGDRIHWEEGLHASFSPFYPRFSCLSQLLFLASPPQLTYKLCRLCWRRSGNCVLQSTTIAAQRAQILLYRLQGQEAAVARASQKLDDSRA